MRNYRGKRIDNGEWVYGWYLGSGDKHYIVDCFGVTSTALVLAHSIADLPGYHEVHSSTVGQSTGQKDRAKKETYGGDLLKYSDRNRDGLIEVIWHEGGWYGQYQDSNFVYLLNNYEMERCEVIGTIHDGEI